MKLIVISVWVGVLAASSGAVAAQSRGLNLDLPPAVTHFGPTPAAASSAAGPGVYYGDHSNAGSTLADTSSPPPPAERKTHVGGSVSTGFYAGSRGVGSGVWNAAQLNVSQPVGEHSLINISVGISKLNSFGGRPGWNGY